MNKYKMFLGMVVDNMIIDGIESYYDLSTDRVEYAFIIKDMGLGINCDLFIKEYITL